MNKLIAKFLLLFLLFIPGIIYSQNTLIYFEDFENTDSSLCHLNTTHVGSDIGVNQWEINNKYIGQPIFPNTISEDSTIGGGQITHPDSNYLHIHDVNINSVSNANFNPTASGDRFTTLGPFCTLGEDDIHFAFFYLCAGDTNNNNAYGRVYYKANNGSWTLAPGGPYSNTYKWNYKDITDPAFANIQNLSFGFRWVNGISHDTTTSFAIDDIKLVGTYDPIMYPVKITVAQLYDVPVCQNSDMLIQLNLSAPLCGQGLYNVQLSEPGGNFSNPYDAGNYLLNNNDSINYLNVPIPFNAPADSCYQIRVIRTDISPQIYSDTSICFTVIACPNTITTFQPVVLSKPLDTVCVYSVIDVPFLSTGVFVNNLYTAQLSDSNGNFNGNNNVLGTLVSDQTYPGPPGTVSGKIVPSSQPIPPGCHYFIRVISSNPALIGSVYGPFCIRDCDMETNNTLDIQVCIPPGIDSCIPVNINTYDSTITYHNGNHFQMEVHSSMDFSLLYKGGLDEGGTSGIVISNKDTCLQMKILDLNYLSSLGLGTGVYYIRIVSDSSSESWNQLGTLIRLTIGAPNPTPLTILYLDQNFNAFNIPDTTVCVGSTMFYEVDPYNDQSTYQWTLNNNDNWPGSYGTTGIIFNAAGDNYLSAVEDNYGCIGPGSDTVHITVRGAPSVSIIGPNQVCPGDTLHYSATLEDQTYYTWSSPTGIILDSSNNNLTITFSTAGAQQINIHAVGLCGVADGAKTITVKAYPIVNAGKDTTVCRHDSVTLSTISGAYTYLWSNGATTRSTVVTPDSTTTYVIASTVTGTAGCTSRDTVTIFVLNTPTPLITASGATTFCQGDTVTLTSSIGTSYLWSNGATTQSIIVSISGNYMVKVTNSYSCYATSSPTTITVNQNPPIPTIQRNGNVLMSSSSTGNQWSLNGDTISEAKSQFYTAIVSGFYTVTVTNAQGCSSTSAATSVTTGIAALINESSFSLFPNPATNQLNIHTSSFHNEAVTVSVMNVLGQEVSPPATLQWRGDNAILNIGNLAASIYFVQVANEHGRWMGKFVKE